MLVAEAARRLRPGQGALNLGLAGVAGHDAIRGERRRAVGVVVAGPDRGAHRLGFGVVDDAAFSQPVLARIIEPTSKVDSLRALDELGIEHTSLRMTARTLNRVGAGGYRDPAQ